MVKSSTNLLSYLKAIGTLTTSMWMSLVSIIGALMSKTSLRVAASSWHKCPSPQPHRSSTLTVWSQSTEPVTEFDDKFRVLLTEGMELQFLCFSFHLCRGKTPFNGSTQLPVGFKRSWFFFSCRYHWLALRERQVGSSRSLSSVVRQANSACVSNKSMNSLTSASSVALNNCLILNRTCGLVWASLHLRRAGGEGGPCSWWGHHLYQIKVP